MIEELVSMCKSAIHLDVNPHRNYYQKPEEYLEEQWDQEKVDPEVMEEIKKLDTLVILQVYPDTPIGFYLFIGYDVEELIKCAIESIKAERAEMNKNMDGEMGIIRGPNKTKGECPEVNGRIACSSEDMHEGTCDCRNMGLI